MKYSFVRAPESLVKLMQEVDPNLDLRFHLKTKTWHVVRFPRGRINKFTRVFSCTHNPVKGTRQGLGYWIVTALKQGDTWTCAKNRVEEIDKSNAIIDKMKDEKMSEYCMDYANDIRQPLIRLYNEGDKSFHRKHY